MRIFDRLADPHEIEIRGRQKNLGRNLIFLQCGSWMLQRLVSEIARQLYKETRSHAAWLFTNLSTCERYCSFISYMARNAHLTEGNKLISSPARQQFRRSNRNRPTETYKFFESASCYGAIQ